MNPTKGLLTGITIESDEYKDSFKRRMRLYLANGYTISMVYGTGMYSHTLNGERHGDTPPGGLTTPEAKAVEIAVVECVVVSFEVQTKTMHNGGFRPVQLDAFVANSKAEELPKQPKDVERRRPRCGVARTLHGDTVQVEQALQLYLFLHLFVCATPHRVRV
jgi:hypothetical protein